MYTCVCVCACVCGRARACVRAAALTFRRRWTLYTRSPLEDSRLFGPSPRKVLAATNEKYISEQPSPWRKSSKRESCYGDRVYYIIVDSSIMWYGYTIFDYAIVRYVILY